MCESGLALARARRCDARCSSALPALKRVDRATRDALQVAHDAGARREGLAGGSRLRFVPKRTVGAPCLLKASSTRESQPLPAVYGRCARFARTAAPRRPRLAPVVWRSLVRRRTAALRLVAGTCCDALWGKPHRVGAGTHKCLSPHGEAFGTAAAVRRLPEHWSGCAGCCAARL